MPRPYMELEVKINGVVHQVVEGVRLRIARYPKDNSLAVTVFDKHGLLFGNLTVCLDVPQLCEDMAFVDTNDCPYAFDFLTKYDLAQSVNLSHQSGYYEYPIARFNLKKMGITQFVVQKSCPICDMNGRSTYNYIRLNADQTDRHFAYKHGKGNVTDLFPDLNPLEREFLNTGMCPSCQARIFENDYKSDLLVPGIWEQYAFEEEKTTDSFAE